MEYASLTRISKHHEQKIKQQTNTWPSTPNPNPERHKFNGENSPHASTERHKLNGEKLTQRFY